MRQGRACLKFMARPGIDQRWPLLTATRGTGHQGRIRENAGTCAGPGGDRLVATTFIQRIATTDGLTPPAAECTAATAVAEVPCT